MATVDLGPIETISEAVAAWQTELATEPAVEKRGSLRAASRKVSTLLWVPLAESLSAVETIHISTDGGGDSIPFSALLDQNGQYLIQSKSFVCETPSRLLSQRTVIKLSRTTARATVC